MNLRSPLVYGLHSSVPVERMWFIASLLVLMGGFSLAEEPRTCGDFLARLRQSTVIYRAGCCNENVRRGLKELEKWEPNFDPDLASVLIIRPDPQKLLFPLDFKDMRWGYHVVLMYEGKILDLDHKGEPLPVGTYFREKFLNANRPKRLRRILDRMVGNPTPWDNLEGMTVSEIPAKEYHRFPPRGFREPPADYPLYPVKNYLNPASD